MKIDRIACFLALAIVCVLGGCGHRPSYLLVDDNGVVLCDAKWGARQRALRWRTSAGKAPCVLDSANVLLTLARADGRTEIVKFNWRQRKTTVVSVDAACAAVMPDGRLLFYRAIEGDTIALCTGRLLSASIVDVHRLHAFDGSVVYGGLSGVGTPVDTRDGYMVCYFGDGGIGEVEVASEKTRLLGWPGLRPMAGTPKSGGVVCWIWGKPAEVCAIQREPRLVLWRSGMRAAGVLSLGPQGRLIASIGRPESKDYDLAVIGDDGRKVTVVGRDLFVRGGVAIR